MVQLQWDKHLIGKLISISIWMATFSLGVAMAVVSLFFASIDHTGNEFPVSDFISMVFLLFVLIFLLVAMRKINSSGLVYRSGKFYLKPERKPFSFPRKTKKIEF